MESENNLRKKLADLIFPDVKSVEYYEQKYPERNLKQGAIVTRFAPSPTGFVHIGGLYQCIINTSYTKRTDGVLFLRIEDTDREREIKDGIIQIIEALKEFGIEFTEGMTGETEEKGNYGPYKQSDRKEIYQAYAKDLILKGKAYPCFLSKEELEKIRQDQVATKVRTGIYGKYAKYREMPTKLAIAEIEKGTPYIVRFKSPGNGERKIQIKDLVKGNLEMPENDQDVVIIKSDGLPTYHFAHAIDDHLMRTTHVIRSDEWVSSLPLHIQLFYELGFKIPKYAHYSPIEKQDGNIRRKISKRKDPEASVMYYLEEGIPKEGLYDYLLNIANSGYENWRKQNPKASFLDYDLKINKMGKSGAIFDLDKLTNTCKICISNFTAEKLYDDVVKWAEKHDKDFYKVLSKDKEYSIKVLDIERGNVKTPRKDISKMKDVKPNTIYMFSSEYYNNEEKEEFAYQKIKTQEKIKEILEKYKSVYDEKDSKEIWWEKMSHFAKELGYAESTKEFKAEPEKYEGHVGDVSTVIRVGITRRNQTPDLYEILKVLGKDEVLKRLDYAIENI